MRFVRTAIKALRRQRRESLIGASLVLVGVLIGVWYYETMVYLLGVLIATLGVFMIDKDKRRVLYPEIYDVSKVIKTNVSKVVETPKRHNIHFGPEGDGGFSLDDVVRIEIETTGDGPFDEDLYWIFHLNTGPPVRMEGPLAMVYGIFDVLEGFAGADMEKVIKSAGVVVPALFLIWEKHRLAP